MHPARDTIRLPRAPAALERAWPRRWLSPLASAALVVALLFAQTLGLAHRALHNGSSDHTSALAALFAAHDEASPVCQLYDQLTHGDLLFAAPAVGACAPPEHAVAPAFAPLPRAASATHFLARAPPRG